MFEGRFANGPRPCSIFPAIDWSSSTRRGRLTRRAAAAAAVLLALVVAPAPLLPPHGLAEAVQRAIGVQRKAAYLLTAVGLQVGFYGSLGILASPRLPACSPTVRPGACRFLAHAA
jgi:hypothetical protein